MISREQIFTHTRACARRVKASESTHRPRMCSMAQWSPHVPPTPPTPKGLGPNDLVPPPPRPRACTTGLRDEAALWGAGGGLAEATSFAKARGGSEPTQRDVATKSASAPCHLLPCPCTARTGRPAHVLPPPLPPCLRFSPDSWSSGVRGIRVGRAGRSICVEFHDRQFMRVLGQAGQESKTGHG